MDVLTPNKTNDPEFRASLRQLCSEVNCEVFFNGDPEALKALTAAHKPELPEPPPNVEPKRAPMLKTLIYYSAFAIFLGIASHLIRVLLNQP